MTAISPDLYVTPQIVETREAVPRMKFDPRKRQLLSRTAGLNLERGAAGTEQGIPGNVRSATTRAMTEESILRDFADKVTATTIKASAWDALPKVSDRVNFEERDELQNFELVISQARKKIGW